MPAFSKRAPALLRSLPERDRVRVLRPAAAQPFPGGLVVRIRRSHRRGPGSIPGQGTLFYPPAADCKVNLDFLL
ncbi:hypothetical protein ROHU_004017 [Labeo rohita]|uniref:Uncharacterized protein n=1 Tax=Labeo rohita TaxID=84645 RepID=A0A498NR54_LABRO|nr:hypothetical protein ROHU_004017 [Labeo rohita]